MIFFFFKVNRSFFGYQFYFYQIFNLIQVLFFSKIESVTLNFNSKVRLTQEIVQNDLLIKFLISRKFIRRIDFHTFLNVRDDKNGSIRKFHFFLSQYFFNFLDL